MKYLLSAQKSPARSLALSVIHRVYTTPLHIQSVLNKEIRIRSLSLEEISFGTELVYGYFRYSIQIEAILQEYLRKIRDIPQAFLLCLGLAIYELLYIDSSFDSSVVFHTVECIKYRYNVSLSRVANAILRKVLRNRCSYQDYSHQYAQSTNNDEQYALQYSLPLYMWKILKERFHEDAHRYAQYFLQRPLHIQEKYNPSTQLLFQELEVANLHTGATWECCSGIGGKHNVLLSYGISPLIASDISLKKLQYQTNRANLLCIDARFPPFKKESLSLVIADVPCSGMGTLRKRPDIKIHRQENDLYTLLSLQSSILEGISSTVKQGGHIVYITCSIWQEENEVQIAKFIQRHPEFSLKQEYIVHASANINDILYGAVLLKESSTY